MLFKPTKLREISKDTKYVKLNFGEMCIKFYRHFHLMQTYTWMLGFENMTAVNVSLQKSKKYTYSRFVIYGRQHKGALWSFSPLVALWGKAFINVSPFHLYCACARAYGRCASHPAIDFTLFC